MNTFQAPTWLPESLIPFFTLSYPVEPPQNPDSYPNSHYYGTGRLDACFVLTWIVVLGILRECLRLGILEPFARQYLYRKDMAELSKKGARNGSTNGHAASNGDFHPALPPPKPVVSSTKNVVKRRPKGMDKTTWRRERSTLRFAEQGWQLTYYLVYSPLGLYVHWGLPSAPFNLDRLWLNYPHIPLAGPLKFYYLTQLAFWFHQVLLLNAEAWRKDHFQMMSHHVITISLVIASYYYNFTRVGVLIMALMDWCDIFLAVMKMVRYLRVPDAVASVVFMIFAVSWVVTRHILFSFVIYSAYDRAPRLIPFTWAPERGHYLTRKAYVGFIALMVALQALLYLWLYTILLIIWDAIRGIPPDDSRSDDEGGAESDDDLNKED